MLQTKLRGKQLRETEIFAKQLMSEKCVRRGGHLRMVAINRLLALGSKTRRWALRECNVACRTDAERARRDKQKDELRAEVEFVAGALGLTAEMDTDPRGYTIKLKLPSGRYNSWDGESWGVPTS